MHSRISINTISTLTWPLEDDLALVARLGAPRLGFQMLKIEDGIDQGVVTIRASGVRVSCVAASTTTIDMMDSDAALAALVPATNAAAQLDCKVCYFTTGRAPERMNTDEACDRLVVTLPPTVSYAKRSGVQLAIENNSVSNRTIGYVHTLHDSFRLAEEADLSICLELQNFWYERDLARIFRDNADRIAVFQISDFKVGEQMLRLLLDAGYQGLFDIELTGPAIDAEGPEAALFQSVDWLNASLEEIGA